MFFDPDSLLADSELLGCSMRRTVEVLLARAELPVPVAEVEALLEEAMLELIRQYGVPLLPGARELLAGVRERGLPHSLVTSSGLVVADAILESAGLKFRIVVTGDDVEEAKPDPEPCLLAARLLGLEPEDCAGRVALEDSQNRPPYRCRAGSGTGQARTGQRRQVFRRVTGACQAAWRGRSRGRG